MAARSPHWRLFAPTAATSLLLLVLGTAGAVQLYRQQAVSIETWSEDLDSSDAADNLALAFTGLALMRADHYDRVQEMLAGIEPLMHRVHELADKPRERELAIEVERQLTEVRSLWGGVRNGPPESMKDRVDAARDKVEKGLLPAWDGLRKYHALETKRAEAAHRNVLGWTAWGLGGVGVVGASAGLLLGYGVARWLRRSIHQLRIQIRHAADKLNQELPAVTLTEEDDLEQLHVALRGLVRQIEDVVTRLQEREHEVLRAEQLAAVGQLAAGVAHELRNPLTSVKMLVQAHRHSNVPLAVAQDLEVIEEEVRRMERRLQGFLDFARPVRPQRRLIDLTPKLERALTLVQGRASQQGVALELHAPSGPQIVEADGEQVQQVLVNLLLNALDAQPDGGRVAVQIRREGDDIMIFVEDDGPGIAARQLPSLFVPFSSTKDTGLGLGLVVSRRIVEDHGGSLTGSNRPEKGACFQIRLPAPRVLAAVS